MTARSLVDALLSVVALTERALAAEFSAVEAKRLFDDRQPIVDEILVASAESPLDSECRALIRRILDLDQSAADRLESQCQDVREWLDRRSRDVSMTLPAKLVTAQLPEMDWDAQLARAFTMPR